jgi:hypothetical protein
LRGRTLVILAFTLVSCSSRLVPASTPIAPIAPLRLVVTPPVAELVTSLTATYSRQNPGIRFDLVVESERAAAERADPGGFWFAQVLDETVQAWAAPIAQDGIAVITHSGVGVRGVTLEQVRGMYDGTIARWSALGGADIPVIVFTREEGAALRTAVTRQVMGLARLNSSARIAPSDAAMRFAVGRTPGAIGYIPVSALDARLHALALDGVSPMREYVAAGVYPLRTITYIVGAAEPQADDPLGMHYRAFIGWVQSAAGQAVVARHAAPLPGFGG